MPGRDPVTVGIARRYLELWRGMLFANLLGVLKKPPNRRA